MGRPGAFLELDRIDHAERSSQESVRDFEEIAIPLPESAQMRQASRCMMCGVSFCQSGMPFGERGRISGCPLHNLIPEWNDLIWRGLWTEAAERLSLTNPFPEFTGRVCPAPCEKACNLGLHEAPTTIRDNERAISDHAWASDEVPALSRPLADAPRVAVVGSGPSGLACAWELARRGAAVTVFERSDRPGGLLTYGIPNMKLPKTVVRRRIALMRESGIEFELDCDASDARVAARIASEYGHVVLAGGAGQARPLGIPGADASGVVFALDFLEGATRKVLDGDDPSISAEGLDVIVVGGGDTGTDCVATAVRQGARSIRQLEFLPEPPRERGPRNPWPEWPDLRKDDYGQREAEDVYGSDPRSWSVQTIEVLNDGGRVSGLRVADLDWSSGRPEVVEGTERVLPAQLILVACGFLGPRGSLLEAFDVKTSGVRGALRPCLSSKEGHLALGGCSSRVYVCGDTRNGASLVVSALSDGLACAAEVAGDLGLWL